MRGNVVDLASAWSSARLRQDHGLAGERRPDASIGMLLGGVDFSDKAIVLKDAVGDVPAVAIKYGAFVNTVIDFAIIAA